MNAMKFLISIFIILIILLQVRDSGAGIFGGGQSTIRSRRGLEKVLFQFTIILAVLFLIISIVSVRLT